MTLPSKFQTFLSAAKSSPATSFLLLGNIAYFFIAIALDNRGLESLSRNSFLANWGANFSVFTLSGEYWRLLTSMFLHVNVVHITLNMVALFSLGEILERKLGTRYFVSVYMLAGLAGSLLSAITHHDMLYLSCGASGAIMGLLGVAVVYSIKHPGEDGFTLGRLGLNAALIFGLGAMANIDNMAHLGGLITGLLMSLWLILPNLSSRTRRNSPVLASLLVAVIIGISYAQAYDGEMRISLEAAKLDKLVGELGFKDSYYSDSFMAQVNREIYSVIAQNAQNKNPDETAQPEATSLSSQSLAALKAIKNDANYISESAEEYARCKSTMTRLQETFSKPDEILLLKDLSDYCEIHQNAFLTIIDEKKTDFNPKLLNETDSKLGNLMESEALNRILSNSNELAAEAVSENACPYTSCKRFK